MLTVAKDGLIQVKHPDIAHSIEYMAILVPDIYFPGLVQSIHIKLNHPSPYQLHKHISRNFYCIAMAKTINNISAACDTCSRLKILPKEVKTGSTTLNTTFGKAFSADILIEKGQHILLCREKLSQFSITKFLPDETKESIQEALVTMLVDFVPDSGTLVQVDPGPGLVALQDDEILNRFNIKLDIGRIHNKQKNPVAENAIKEFRKEWLRLYPEGTLLSEIDRASITSTMNKRIRMNGLAPKEFMLKRNLCNHDSLTVNDQEEGRNQFQRRSDINTSQSIRDSTTKPEPAEHNIQVGERVFIKSDLNKSRGREEYIVTKKFHKDGITWVTARKSQKGFRSKEYLLKLSEIIPAPFPMSEIIEPEDQDDDFHGFQPTSSMGNRDQISQLIREIEKDIPTKRNRGRPRLLKYPDYAKPLPEDIVIDDEYYNFHGFQSEDINVLDESRKKLQSIIDQMSEVVDSSPEEDEPCHGFQEQDLHKVQVAQEKIKNIIDGYEYVTNQNNIRLQSLPKNSLARKYAWNYEEWLNILETDYIDENIDTSQTKLTALLFKQLPNNEVLDFPGLYLNETSDALSFDDTEVEYQSFQPESEEQSLVNEILQLEISHLQDFNSHFSSVTASTPTKRLFKSVTDPLWLDKIPVLSSSDSSFEEQFSPDRNGEKTKTPINLVTVQNDKVLNIDSLLVRAQEECIALQNPEPGRVYRMDPILDDIFPDTHQNSRPIRTTKKHDYKKLHTEGL